LDKSAEKGVSVEWNKADCRDFRFNKRFNLILFPFNAIAYLHDLESVEACLSCVKEHLTNRGRFIIDFLNPRLDILTRDPSQRYPVAEYPDLDGKGTVVIAENHIYDAATQISRIKYYYKIGEKAAEFVEEVNMRMFYPQELDALLHYNGFTIEARFGNCDETLFTSSSPKQVLVCYR